LKLIFLIFLKYLVFTVKINQKLKIVLKDFILYFIYFLKKMTVVTFYLTGFGKFQGVTNNPTTQIMEKLPVYLQSNPLKSKNEIKIEFFQVLETSGQQYSGLNKLQAHFCEKYKTPEERQKVVFIHFGVGNSRGYHLEKVAWNEATFRCPDERGWAPLYQCINPNYPLNSCLNTPLPLEEIKKNLQNRGIVCELSDDPGRFVCNYTYYESLQFTQSNSSSSLFVHVPSQSIIPVENQVKFVKELLEIIADLM